MKAIYEFIPLEFLVGSKEYKKFREWMDSTGRYSSRMGLMSLKPAFLKRYFKEYRYDKK